MTFKLKEKKQLNIYFGIIEGEPDWQYYLLVDDENEDNKIELIDTSCEGYCRYEVRVKMNGSNYQYIEDEVAEKSVTYSTIPREIEKQIRPFLWQLKYLISSKESLGEYNGYQMICYDYPPPVLELVSEKEQNPFYDENRSNNGGGYHQPLLKYVGEIAYKPATVSINDTSCGEFGCRYGVIIELDDEKYEYYLNTMGNEDKEESTIPVYVAKNIGPWISELGYPVKSKAAMVDIEELLEE